MNEDDKIKPSLIITIPVKMLEFKKNGDNYEAKTPIGRYYIDYDGVNYESYSDLEEIGTDLCYEHAVLRANLYHREVVNSCLEKTEIWTDQ